jgi:hypothetical protein
MNEAIEKMQSDKTQFKGSVLIQDLTLSGA